MMNPLSRIRQALYRRFRRWIDRRSPLESECRLDHRRLYISGTASIEPGGATAHVGDVDKQIDLTMDVVEAILESRDMGWSDTTRAAAYFKDVESIPAFASYCRAKGLPPLPVAIAHSDICRDDLLFEIEMDAVVARGG